MAALRESALPASSAGHLALWLGMAVVVGAAIVMLQRFAFKSHGRHQLLAGTAPQDAFLQADLGVPTSAPPLDPVLAMTVLPDLERSTPRGPVELTDHDIEIVQTLGPDHPMSTAGRHRSVAVHKRITLPDDAAELLLVPQRAPILTEEETADPAGSMPLPPPPHLVHGLEEGSLPAEYLDRLHVSDDTPADAEGAHDWHKLVDLSTIDTGSLAEPAPRSMADHHYHLDWDAPTSTKDSISHQWSAPDDASRVGGWWSGDDRAAAITERAAPTLPPFELPTASALAPSPTGGSTLIPGPRSAPPLTDVSVDDWISSVAPEQAPLPASTSMHPELASEFALSVRQQNALTKARARLAGAANRIILAELVTKEAAELIECENAALVIRSLEGPRVLWQHPGGELWGPQTLAALLTVGASVRTVAQGDPLSDDQATALLAVPVASAGDLAGMIIVRRTGRRPFTAADESILDRLARVAGTALDALTRRGALRLQEENVDAVTGLAPNESMMRDLQVALRTQVQHGMPISILVIGVDGLDHLKAEQGQQIAEHALRQAAEVVACGLRVGDVPYRKGESELAVLLAATGYEAALRVGDRLRDAVDAALGRLAQGRLAARVAVVPVSGTAEDVVRSAEATLATERMNASH